MMHLRACPRCHGSLLEQSDHNGPYRQCLQCGYEAASGPPLAPVATPLLATKETVNGS